MRVRLSVSFFYSIFFLCFIATRCVWAGWEGDPPLKMKYEEHEFLAACREGNIPAVEFYLDDKDFDPNKNFPSGRTKKMIFGLYLAAHNGHDRVVQILVQTEGVNVNQAMEDGATPLFIASQNGHYNVVETLVAAGADPNLSWRFWRFFSKSPLKIARNQRSLERKKPQSYATYSRIISTLSNAATNTHGKRREQTPVNKIEMNRPSIPGSSK